MPKLSRLQVSIGVIVILHTVGIGGMFLAKEWFIPLTPLNLIVSGYFVLRHAEQPKILTYLAIAVLSFAIEAIGVATGWPFGDYHYERALGPHLFHVPVLIGMLWLLLLAGGLHLATRVTKSRFVQIAIAAVLMTAIDFLIEPVAIDFEYWQWHSSEVPINNYVGWFVTGFVLAGIGNLSDNHFRNNKVAGVFFIVQFVFFLSLNLLVV